MERFVFSSVPFAPFRRSPAQILASLQQALLRLADHGVAVAKSLVQYSHGRVDALPHPDSRAFAQAQIDKALLHAARAVTWAVALGQVFAGTFILPRRRAPAPPAPMPALMPLRPLATTVVKKTDKSARASDGQGWMRRVFATRSIGYIVQHICADLGIEDDDDLWPADLAGLRQTAADLTAPSQVVSAPSPPTPEPKPTSETETETATDPDADPGIFPNRRK